MIFYKYLRPKSFSLFKAAQRSLSYVEKCKYLQDLKGDSVECLQLLPQAKFMVYKGSQPLMKEKPQTLEKNIRKEINWLQYEDLLTHKAALMQTHVLIDVDENRVAQFGVQLGRLDPSSVDDLEAKGGGSFVDLRAALFMVGWGEAHVLSKANALLMFNKTNKFCGRCGESTVRNAAGTARKCSGCENSIYPHSSPVGIVLVTDPARQHALLVRGPRQPQGMFSCVAGFADVGETLEETVKREVAEEVGLLVREVQYVASQHWPFPGSLMVGCFAVAEKEELSLDLSELEGGKWFSREEIGAAIARTHSDPFLRLRSSSPDQVFIPPPGAIAYYLINHWYEGTPAHQIASFIK